MKEFRDSSQNWFCNDVLMASKALIGTELSSLTSSHDIIDYFLLGEMCFELSQSS